MRAVNLSWSRTPRHRLFPTTVTAFLVVALCGSGPITATEPQGLTYRNPRVYNVHLSFALAPDPAAINPKEDLKLWIPMPREWDSQRAVEIISVQPPPHGTFEDPDYGNRMFFWDFSREPEAASYRVDLQFRLESLEVEADLDPHELGTYDKSSEEYRLYTRSQHTILITPKVTELARQAVQGETNPYLQAQLILSFVKKRMRWDLNPAHSGRLNVDQEVDWRPSGTILLS